MTEPPTLGGALTANTQEEKLDPTSDPLSLPATDRPQLLDHKPSTVPPTAWTPPPSNWTPPIAPAPPPPPPTPPPAEPDKTLTDLEKSVDSPHTQAESVDTARDQVDAALRAVSSDNAAADEPIQALNAQPLGGELHIDENGTPSTAAPDDSKPQPQVNDPTAPPPVPPPIPFDFNKPPSPNP